MSQSREHGAAGREWVSIGAANEFDPGSLRAIKCAGEQLVVGRTEAGDLFALDNRCPHEGYPLATGTLKGCALTCCWHNWKFDVATGACTLGGEGVRRFPLRVLGEELEVDLTPPDPKVAILGYLESMREAVLDHDIGRALRDAARLLKAGMEAADLFAEVAAIDSEHGETGSNHTLAVAADSLRSLDVFPGMRSAIPLGTVLDLCSESNQRLPRRPRPAAIGFEGEGLERAVRSAVEAEDLTRAEGLFLGAFESGTAVESIEAILFAVLSDHFLSFGHPLIYLTKARELLADRPREFAERILPALLFRAGMSTREDTLPYMEAHSRRWREVESECSDLWANRSKSPLDASALRDLVLDGSPEEAFHAVLDPLRAGADPEEVAQALVGAAAHRLWRFDLAVEHDPDVIESWLFATHRFTFASAVRVTIRTFDSPDALRFLFQCAAFTQTGHRMDRPEAGALPEPVPLGMEDILLALQSRDVERAVGGALGFLQGGGSVVALRGALRTLVHSDPAVRPIVVAHVVKTVEAAFDEYEALVGHPDRAMTLAATLRFLGSPVVERRVRETAERSIRWVIEGKMPKKLTQ